MLEEFDEARSKTEAKIEAKSAPATVEVDGKVSINVDEIKSVLEGLYCGIFATKPSVNEAYEYGQLLMRAATDIDSVDYSYAISVGVYQNSIYKALMENFDLELNDDVSEY